jgi:ubiquinone/menaquinone biosynthesis C-methylase UbiE
MLAVAKAAIPDVDFIECDASNTQLPANSFDAVFSMRFFGHVPVGQRTSILTELARISRDRVIIEIAVTSRSARVAKTVLRRLTVGSRLPHQRDWHLSTLSAVREQAAQSGLRVVAARHKLPILSDSRFVEFRVVPR